MNILQSIAGNKTILNVALNQIGAAMERDGVAAFVIIRNTDNQSEESKGLDIQTYKEAIAVISGDDLKEYQAYLDSKANSLQEIEAIIDNTSENDRLLAEQTEPVE